MTTRSTTAQIETYLLRGDVVSEVVVEVSGATGRDFFVTATPMRRPDPIMLGAAPLSVMGDGRFSYPLLTGALDLMPEGMRFELTAYWMDSSIGSVMQSPSGTLTLGAVPCEEFGFNVSPGGPLLAGEEIAEQWSEIGVHISAQNKVAGHPDKVIIFDSANPTGGDDDLRTPGTGPNNTQPLGNLMIVAENCVDMNNDGYVDDPDDEAGGGIITFDFDQPAEFCSIKLVDLDDGGGSELRFFLEGVLQDTVALPPGGPNSVTTIAGVVEKFDRMEVDFVSSGGIAAFEFIFCPLRVGFDTLTSGITTGLVAGEEVTTQFAGIGLSVSAKNNDPSHPDMAILFDSAAPTGGDTDLQTPGFGVGNTEPEGLVLIIAENSVDANADDLVDDPDDEVAGGVIHLDFEMNVIVESLTVLDIDLDEGDSAIVMFDSLDNLVAILALAPLGDNSSQTFSDLGIADVRRIEVRLSGSGALADLQFCPEVP